MLAAALQKSCRKRCVIFVLLAVSICGLLITRIPLDGGGSWIEKRMCYLSSQTEELPNDLKLLPDVLAKDAVQPTPGNSIFFHETSCSREYKIALNARQACAIESAAKTNPNRQVFVLFTSPRVLDDSLYTKTLLKYPNINLRNVDIWKYSQDSIIEEWIYDNVLFTSAYVHFHMSDYMRYLSLNRYRGTYLDMDVIVRKSFDAYGGNFAGAESADDVAAGIISFDDSPLGREMSRLCLTDFKLHFSGSAWGNNGPGVITRVLEAICSTSNTTLMTKDRCHGFDVLPPSKCYAVPFRKWERFFDPAVTKEVLDLLEDSVIVHFWNKFSIKRTVQLGDGSAYDLLAKEFCPLVYAATGVF